MNFFDLSLLLTTFLFSGFAIYGLLPVGKISSELNLSRSAVLSTCMGLGPLMISYLLSQVMKYFPGHGGAYYVGTILLAALILVLIALVLRFRRPSAAIPVKFDSMGLQGFSIGTKITAFLLIGILLLLCIGVAIFPLYSNDPLGYFQAAKIVSQYADFGLYPIVDTEASNGFYGPWTHPPGYVGILVWSNFFNADLTQPGVGRFVTAYFCIVTCLVLTTWLGVTGLIASMFLVTTPIYFSGISSSHIDGVRVFPVLIFFLWLYSSLGNYLFKRESCSNSLKSDFLFLILPSGIFFGLAIFVHAFAIVCLPVWLCLYLVYSKPERLSRYIIRPLGMLVCAGLLIANFMMVNYERLGVFISDTPQVWQLEKLQHNEHVNQQRGLGNFKKKITNGILKGLTRMKSFGFTYWVLLIGVIYFARSAIVSKNVVAYLERNKIATYSLLLILLYFGMTVASVVLDSSALIKNDRYLLTIHPFVALFCAWFVICIFKPLFGEDNDSKSKN